MERFNSNLQYINQKEAETWFIASAIYGKKDAKYVVIQDRDVRYRFHSHSHPYIGQLVQRLLRGGVRGLQAADTDYVKGGISLPGSVEVSLPKDAIVNLSAQSEITLLASVEATLSGGQKITLTPAKALAVGGTPSASVGAPAAVILIDGIGVTPHAGSDIVLNPRQAGILVSGVEVKLRGATSVTLPDGRSATLPASTSVVARGGSQIEIASGTRVVFVKSQQRPVLYDGSFFQKEYDPSRLVLKPYPAKELDFSSGGAYSAYNWEVFFHAPLAIAIHLSQNQRFAEAQQWFHYLFDPTDDSEGPTPARFWKVRPFQSADVRQIQDLLVNLATGADEELRNETVRSIEAWSNAPFRPHVIARYRHPAYMYKTVMAYLDNLIAWGDSLFRQDTGEAIDEALMVYVLAANILGPRPEAVPKVGSVRPQTYVNLRKDLKQFGTVMREVEADIPFAVLPFPTETSGSSAHVATIRSLGKALYFGVPRNDKLLGYWDTVADRLFKIRNSLNLQGVFRQLALFEPPIDPALLARAAAAGLDVGSIVNGLSQPLPLVRFQVLVQKANELVQEVKSLGSGLLSAMEKEDGESLAILRAKHERTVLGMAEQIKYGQLQEAIKAKEGLIKSLELAVQRYSYYELQLGKGPDEIEQAIPGLDELDRESLEKLKFAMTEPVGALRDIEIDIASSLGESGGKIVSSHELAEIKRLSEARDSSRSASAKEQVGAGLSTIPEFSINLAPLGVGTSTSYGGSGASRVMSFWASYARADADKLTFEASNSARVGSFSRREQDWAFQSNLAAGEIAQTFKQLRAAQLREAIAEQELKSHRKQMEQAGEIDRFLNEEGTQSSGKKTNKALYAWMKREVKGLYSQCFQLAFDVAKRAERALQHELGNRDQTFLQFGYLAGNEGLLAGEKLALDVKRMEVAYHELNHREYEMTKHVSLLQVDPRALLSLRRTGRCTVELPEALFDMDWPGHFFRRIKTVGVSIPCVSGPYASVNCTLSLLKSRIRKTPILKDGAYARDGAEDDRFEDYLGSVQSIVTSSAQNDGGLFETNLRDERYLPFENSGADSEWQLELPGNPTKGDPVQFDFETISDVILHVRYTAREGGSLLRDKAVSNLKELIAASSAAGSVRLFSIRDEFPSEWARFQAQVPSVGQRFALEFKLGPEHYPFWSKGLLGRVQRADLFALSGNARVEVSASPDGSDGDTLNPDETVGTLLKGQFKGFPANPVGDIKLYFDDKVSDLWLAVTWGASG
ncbi:insecticidal toxin protein [Vulgatibacter incomptus]|uniref:Insecticidal toxin complex protein TccB1 n=1 Tax=Vulgatibacter incomptus TaxID=1391653 RepID=A0A0K1PFQ3_9BACT|nr:insecticidal toxin protein [Vulgatibacter incomptus]AKU92350.1 Insecticidal toxin complex protein TccB1 [Vulgatibacter incomptus]